MAVFVLDKRGKPLMPCTEKRARLLLARRRARVHRVMPFTIRITDRQVNDSKFQPLRIKIDPGSKTTGIALVRDKNNKGDVEVLNLFNLIHRGQSISESLSQRRAFRRRRRGNLRYRAKRFLNRGNKSKGWLAPSLQHRIDTTIAWVKRISRLSPISALSMELVRFDMQQMENPEISGKEYQHGTLAGFEVREYLLEKWQRKCAYCDVKDVPLNLDHIKAKSNGGSNRVSNLTLACINCNKAKDNLPIDQFLKDKPQRLLRIQQQVKTPLKDAAAVNSTRWALFTALKKTGLEVETGSGGKTKFNRSKLKIPKDHALEALCVGEISSVTHWNKPIFAIKSTGRGCYQRTRLTAYGFPRGYLMRKKQIQGFQTGDMVKAIVDKGKKTGTYIGRVAIRSTGNFNIQTDTNVIQGISNRYCKIIQRGDGYHYSQRATLLESESGKLQSEENASRSALRLPGINAGVSRAKI